MSENINKQSFDTYEESSENNILDVDQEVLASEEASEEEQLEEKESDAVNCVSKPIDPVQEIRIIEEKLGFKEIGTRKNYYGNGKNV